MGFFKGGHQGPPAGRIEAGHKWAGGICVENVSFGYENERVIDDAHFHIDQGSLVSFIGPNGGGKSTLVETHFGFTGAG